MVRLIVGGKGSGKTKRIIEMANKQVEATTGHVVYIDDDMKHSFEIHHDIRLMNMEEYPIQSPDEFFGFLCGILSTDYDVEKIFIDGLINLLGLSSDELPDYIEKMDKMCEQYDMEFVISATVLEADLDESLAERVI